MEKGKEANKLIFGSSLSMFFIFGLSILLNGFQTKSTIVFLIGIYNIWLHGFVKDSSKWKVEPKLMLIVSVIILFLTYAVLNLNKSN